MRILKKQKLPRRSVYEDRGLLRMNPLKTPKTLTLRAEKINAETIKKGLDIFRE